MTNIKRLTYTLVGCSLLFLLAAGPAKAGICPAVGLASDCGVVLNVTSANGAGLATAFSVTNTGNGNPYDGVEDTLVGLTNSSGVTLNTITLTASIASDAFGFDSDGACTLGAPPPCGGATGYEGPNMTFSAVSFGATTESMTITLTGGLASGSSTWFSLEGTPNSLSGGLGAPEPASILLLGTGLAGLALRRFMA